MNLYERAKSENYDFELELPCKAKVGVKTGHTCYHVYIEQPNGTILYNGESSMAIYDIPESVLKLTVAKENMRPLIEFLKKIYELNNGYLPEGDFIG